MDITQTLEDWLKEAEFADNVAFHQLIPARKAAFEPFSASIHPAVQIVLN